MNQSEEGSVAMDRLLLAQEQQRNAQLAVARQFLPHGNGQPTLESMRASDEADVELEEAKAAVGRIAEEIGRGAK